MRAGLVLLATLILATVCTATTARAQAAGTVVDRQGRPIAGVIVNAQLQEVVQTAADGTYRVKERSDVIRFFKAGYRPTTRLVESLADRVVLEDAVAGPVVLPCRLAFVA